MFNKKKIIIGSRGSKLALWQAKSVKKLLLNRYPGLDIDIIIIKTKGDVFLETPVVDMGGKAIFIKEIEDALLSGKIDIAVHSMKDMSSEVPSGLYIAAVTKREDPRDVVVSNSNRWIDIKNAPIGSKIGTGSLRRLAQLAYFRPDFNFVSIRGNLETRIRKMKDEKLDAIILAAAGMIRLDLKKFISHYLSFDEMLPAVGQGVICIEARIDDTEINKIINFINHKDTELVVSAERAFLVRIDGNCKLPIAANAILKSNEISLTGLVASLDGSVIIKKTIDGSYKDANLIGKRLAELLISLGAKKILK